MEPKIERNLIKVWQPSDLTYLELQRGFSVNRPVPRHWHEEYQFCLVESGEGDLTYRGKDFLTPPVSLFIVHPGEVHSNRAFEDSGCSFRTIFLEPGTMQKVVSQIQGKVKALPFFPSTMIFDRAVLQEFITLHQSLEEPVSSLESEIRLQNFLVGLVSRFAETPLSIPSYSLEKMALDRSREYLIANYAENITLEKLAGIANLSPFHFNRVFSQQFGMPPHKFLVQLRLSKAKSFLQRGMNIAQAAAETGFADQSHLTRHFKRVFGITPGQCAQT